MIFAEFKQCKTEVTLLIWPPTETLSLGDQSPPPTHKQNRLKVEKMKIFVTTKEDFTNMELVANRRPLQSSLATLSPCLYLVYETTDTRDYMHSFVMSTCGILGLVIYCITIFKMASIYELGDRYETAINGSKQYH